MNAMMQAATTMAMNVRKYLPTGRLRACAGNRPSNMSPANVPHFGHDVAPGGIAARQFEQRRCSRSATRQCMPAIGTLLLTLSATIFQSPLG